MKALDFPYAMATRRGAALIATLAILVLLVGLTLAIFLSAASERRSAALYKHSQGLRELSDSAVNLVMAQIRDATASTAYEAPADRLNWASQPGMLRTYGAGTNAVASYKLYSWIDPRPAGDVNDTVPGDWGSNRALFADLNEPVADSEDPGNPDRLRYPIAYPPLPQNDPTRPAGYSVVNAPGFNPGNPLSPTNNPVPMPVQWLYVLQNGTMVYPSNASGATVTIPGATTANPIVGRIAYWTDDETSKVNLNTAAGGEYWVKPVQKTKRQFENSVWQPTRWEFQRYPGHPMRTDLTKVFPPALFGFGTDAVGLLETRRKIWELIPRVADNGATALSARSVAPQDVPYDMDRLFASTGEVRFAANPPDTGARAEFLSGDIWRERIERLGFLTTTASRAPETTVYGTPRVSLWPVSSQNTTQRRTALDNLMAFASTIQNTSSINNPLPYYFQRTTAGAPDYDLGINAAMFNYLESLSSVSSIPGFTTASLLSKYGEAGRDQILTQMYDYIRIVNKMDRQLPTPSTNSFAWNNTVPPTQRTVNGRDTFGFGRFPTINQIVLHFICTADAAVPGSNVPENLSLRASPDAASFTPLSPGQRNIMAIAYVEIAVPANAFPGYAYQDIRCTIRGLDRITLNDQPMGFPDESTLSTFVRNVPNDTIGDATNINTGDGGGPLKYLIFIARRTTTNGSTRALVGRAGFSGNVNGYPLVSDSIRVASNPQITIGSADLEVDLSLTSAPGLVHAVQLPFAGGSFPSPTLPTASASWVFDQVGWNGSSQGRFPNDNPEGWERQRLFLDTDTVVSAATVHGDYRISMARPTSPTNWGMVPPLVSAPGYAHRLHNTSGGNFIPHSNIDSGVLGILQEFINSLRIPVPPSAQLQSLGMAHPLTYGDFDNGLPNMADGALINAPDEIGGWAAANNNNARGLYWGNSIADQLILASFHTPNRKIASPIAFGSLPSAAVQDRPWQTLLFRPAPEVTNHPGRAGFNIDGTASASAPADFHWLDYFWMPIVEPYAISENFSTAGKINMNHRIAPFNYIRRTTGLEAVLGSGGVIAAPSQASAYTGLGPGRFRKSVGNNFFDQYLAFESQFDVNTTETLIGFDNRLGANALFRSAGELCQLPIVPIAPGATFASLSNGSWWLDYRYTGDNTREATYSDIYPRLTTRSNTFTVHHRVQVLQKLPGANAAVWDENVDRVASESRGQTLIERYLDPNEVYPNYATNFPGAESLEAFYRFRVLRRADFTP